MMKQHKQVAKEAEVTPASTSARSPAQAPLTSAHPGWADQVAAAAAKAAPAGKDVPEAAMKYVQGLGAGDAVAMLIKLFGVTEVREAVAAQTNAKLLPNKGKAKPAQPTA